MLHNLQTLVKTLFVATAVGVINGALGGVVIGAAFGLGGAIMNRDFAYGFDTTFGSAIVFGILCAAGGVWFGLIGGCTGGLPGWVFAGLAGGSAVMHLLTSARRFDATGLMPACILAAVGIAVSIELKRERPRLPLLGRFKEVKNDCALFRSFRDTRIFLAAVAILWGGHICYRRVTAPPTVPGIFGGNYHDDDDDAD